MTVKLAEASARAFRESRLAPGKWTFVLARRFRALDGVTPDSDPAIFRPALEALFHAAESAVLRGIFQGEDDLFIDFAGLWPSVRHAEGDGPLESAHREALARPVLPPSVFGAKYDLFVSIAFYLQLMQGDDPILLPVERTASLLGTSAMQVSRMRQIAERAGLLRQVERFSLTQRKATTFRFDIEVWKQMTGEIPGTDGQCQFQKSP